MARDALDSVSGSPDPVELVKGKRRANQPYRCDACGELQFLPADLPPGGLPCVRCGEVVNGADSVLYASLEARLIALLTDATILGVLTLTFLGAWAWFVTPFSENERVARAFITASVGAIASVIACIVMYECIGSSPGKSFAGIRVRRARDGRKPGPLLGFLRAASKVLTVATLGVGYLALRWDPERRALHDWVTGTRVIE